MEKLDKVIRCLELCYRDECESCDYCGNGCSEVLMGDARELLREYRELFERNTWPCWQCDYAWMKFRKYKIMFGPDDCDVHRDKMCPVLDEEETDGSI